MLMLSLKDRLKILSKIAQQETNADPAATTANPAPATPAATTTPLPSFNPIGGPWAWIPQRYNPNTVRTLSYLLGMIHTSMHYATNGQFNLLKNQNNLSSVDASAASSTDGKNLILLAQLFYRTLLNNGNEPKAAPTGAQIEQWAAQIASSQPLLNLSQLNPTGPAAQKMNLDGSLRQNLMNYLGYLKMYNPIEQQQKPQ
jgi:hypothetical protein